MRILKITELPLQHRKVFLHIIRNLAIIQLSHWVSEYGLEKTEELILELLNIDRIVLNWDRKRDEFWLEEI